MRRLIPNTLAGRTIAILLVGLGLFHLWSIWVYQLGLESLLGSSREQELAERLVAVTRAIAALPEGEREQTAHALSTADMEIHWSRLGLVNPADGQSARLRLVRDRLRELLPEIAFDQVRLGFADEGTPVPTGTDASPHLLLAAVQLADGSWVNFSVAMVRHEAGTQHDVLGSLTAMAIGILLVSVVLVRTVTAPLRTLARAADRIGVDAETPEVPQTGPVEVQQAARAFNRMQARIRRLIDDRTQTLAAVSHDLKTPITRLRLRTEFVRDDELRRTIEGDLDEMERMLEATLAFLRGDATGEEVKTIDLPSVLESLCDELSDGGHDVAFAGMPHAPLRCRPLAIKRAFSNLLENAVKYGTRARATLHDEINDLIVVVEDEGPGIPERELERVFDPFYRLEASRSRETGGTGLGLTIARTAIRAHGGDIRLVNRDEGGLRVVVTLPKLADL